MGKNAYFVSHKKSKLKENGGPKLPLASDLVEGEIAINFGKNVETLSIKNESGDVVTFSSDNYYTEKKLGSGFTGENSANTVTSVIESNEKVTALALQDLEARKLDREGYIPFNPNNYYTKAEIENRDLWEEGDGQYSVIQKIDSLNKNEASGKSAIAEGFLTKANGDYSHAEGYGANAKGGMSHAEGYSTTASGSSSHAEGLFSDANGNRSHAEGYSTTANGDASHAEGYETIAEGDNSHAEGSGTTASGNSSHAEGYYTRAVGHASHAEGIHSGIGEPPTAYGVASHVEGSSTTASGNSSHAEGTLTRANGGASHAEGEWTNAEGDHSHAEGRFTAAFGEASHAEGLSTKAFGEASHAEGRGTSATNSYEHASGQYNLSNSATTTFGDSGNTLFSVGNGRYDTSTATELRHNAFEIRQNGDIYITSGGTTTSQMIKLQDYIGDSITVDQVLDNTTSASTNPVSSKAVYSAMTDNELVWANAYVAMSGTVSAHTANTEIHVTAADKTAWNAKLDAADVEGFFGAVNYDSTSKRINFYNTSTGGTVLGYIDATDFIKDGMVSNVEIKDVTSGGSQVTCLVISFNTDAGKQDINIPLTDIFDASNYYTKSQTSGATELSTAFDAIDNLVGSGFTSSSITEVIIENEKIVSAALNDLDDKKLDVSAYTPTMEIWVSGSGVNSAVLKGGSNTASGTCSVAEGAGSNAIGNYSHAEGHATASGDTSHAEGNGQALGGTSHAEGNGRALGGTSHAEGNGQASGIFSHAEGSSIASGVTSHAEGNNTVAIGQNSHAEGNYTTASGQSSHAEGDHTTASGQSSHAEGSYTVASGNSSHAEGYNTTANGNYSHSEGYYTTSSGAKSHAEGDNTTASGDSSHAEGKSTKASGECSHAEGGYTTASGNYSHAEGDSTVASGYYAHAEGSYTTASGRYSHAEGSNTIANNQAEHASGQYNISSSASTTFGDSGNTLFSVGNGASSSARHNAFEIRQNGDIYITSGNSDIKLQDYIGGTSVEFWVSGTGLNSVVLKGSSGTASGDYSVAEGYSYEYNEDAYTSIASGSYSHTEGSGTKASGDWGSHAEGDGTVASGESSHAEGSFTTASGDYSHAEGSNTTASGDYSHAEGDGTVASGESSHAEGYETKASSIYSHAEGEMTEASGEASHAEGERTEASGEASHAEGTWTKANGYYGSHAEGNSTVASGESSHAEGYETKANGDYSHAEGSLTNAEGDHSHAEGWYTVASGNSSHAEGWDTVANNNSEHASGQYNVSSSGSSTFGDSGNTLFSVGNGTSDNARHNAFEIRQNGDIYITSGNSDIKLQDNIGKVNTITAITPSNSGSTDPIATKVVAENELTVSNALTDLNTNKADKSDLGGLKLVKVTQAEYDALVTKDSNTLYVIVN